VPTVWERENRIQVNEKMKDEQWLLLLTKTALQLNNGEYPQPYLDALFQKWRGAYTIYDALPFLMAHSKIRNGEVAIYQVPIGSTPKRDSDIEGNTEILKTLPFPFEGRFWGGNQDEDGFIITSSPVNATVLDNETKEQLWCIVPPGRTPLEVGYMNAYKLPLYFVAQNGLARWPYYQDRITVFTSSGIGTQSPDFDRLYQECWGDFDSLPNPYMDWWRKETDPPPPLFNPKQGFLFPS
jgi:hypothetical protein